MPEKPSYEELAQRVETLESQIALFKHTEKELLECLKREESDSEKDCVEGENCFLALDDDENRSIYLGDEDVDVFEQADRNIQILEAYEYYLSEAFPIMIMLSNALNEFPVLENFLEELLTDILSAIDEKSTQKDIMKIAVDSLQNRLKSNRPFRLYREPL